MSLDFARIKEIRITDVATRYGISLTVKGAWANGICKLPTHKANDKGKNFSVNIAGNFWRCFSQSCNEANGGKRGGDVISFVAIMDNCPPKAAAEKLATWYNVLQTTNAQNKTAPHIEKPSVVVPEENQHAKDSPEHSSSGSEVKGRYMEEVDTWFNETFKRGEKETDVDYWKRIRKGVKAKLIESYRSGKKSLVA